MSEPRPRVERADSVRNRSAILEAARRHITADGPDVSMSQIAAASGVAVGTLYRHFPTKADLVSAAVGEFVADVADRAEEAAGRVAAGGDAFAELDGLLRTIAVGAAGNHAVKAAANLLGADVEGSGAEVLRAHAAIQIVLDIARADGRARDDLSIDDLYLLINHAPPGHEPAALERWADLVVHGIAGRDGRSKT